MSIKLPFAGPTVIPPVIAFAIVLNEVHSPARRRLVHDEKGYDCNDYAFDAVQDLLVDARDPYYVDCKTEEREGHLIAAYATEDGTVYARDNRVPDDVPLEELVARGYTLLSAADRKGELWHGYASEP